MSMAALIRGSRLDPGTYNDHEHWSTSVSFKGNERARR